MTYKEKENLLKIQNVTATMAIEGMYFNRDFLQKMMQVSRGASSKGRANGANLTVSPDIFSPCPGRHTSPVSSGHLV